MTTPPRIAPLPVSALRPEWEATLTRIPGSGLKGEGSPHHVMGTLMHAPATLGAFLDYWVTSKETMAFSLREPELLILRMGVLYRSEYVWRHHVPVAREFGVAEATLEALRTGDLASLGDGRDRAVVELTDELVNHRTIGDEAWRLWASKLSPLEVIELIGLVAQYVLFALTNNAFCVALERPMLAVPGLEDSLAP